MKSIRHILADQKGAYFLMSAIVLSVMVGFAALGVEIGRWYGIQAEISKSIDGAAFAGAKNVSNPKFPDDAALVAFVEEVAAANFPAGLLDTDTPVFVGAVDADGKVTVNGNTNSINHMTTIFSTGTHKTNLGAVGAAKLRKAEVAMVLDVSGSMNTGNAIDDLRTGADTFVNNFQSFQKDHKFSLITFASGVQTPVPLKQDFVFDMTTEIGNLIATGGTNTEDALAQALALPWEPGQLALPANERTRQVLILFSDGNPTAFRGNFKRDGTTYDAAVPDGSVSLRYHDQQHNQISSYVAYGSGSGVGNASCTGGKSVEWQIFADPNYGLNSTVYPPYNGYSNHHCFTHGQLQPYVTAVARQKAIDNDAALKLAGIEIYTIGLGAVDQAFLESLATDSAHAYFANDPADLEGIFQTIANQLKLILVS